MPFSISQKLAATVVIAVGVSGLLTGAVALRQDYLGYAQTHRDALLSAGSAFAAAIAHPVAEGNPDTTFAALRGIGTVPNLAYAVAKDMQGRVVSTVGTSAQLDGDATVAGGDEPFLDLLTSHTIRVVVPVVDAGVDVGRLELVSDAGDLLPGLIRSALMSLTGTALALVVGLALATRVQAAIIRPLKELTEAMKRVRSAHDFSAELPTRSDDELGVLVSGYNAMLTDIRERDERLRRHRDRLEQDVAGRTQDLALARDEALRATAAKSDFLATMSHEIRTPMSGLLVMAELLASGDLPARFRRYAEVISDSGRSLLTIINDILDFAKIEAGKLELEAIDTDVEQVVRTVMNLFQARAREKGLELVAEIAPDVPSSITADPVRLNQVISNLVGNALKFTSAGSVTVAVTWIRGSRPALRIAVIDTGIGIPADKLDAIFEAFGQADQSTTRQFGGTGLGLAISNRIVRAMGSEIKVESQPGAGSTFFFLLEPGRVAAAPPWPELPSNRAPASAWLALPAGGSRTAIERLLEASGFQTSLAKKWGSAPEPLLSLVLAADLRKRRERPVGRYVVALAEPDDLGDLSSSVADLVLPRPVLRSDLRSVVTQVATGQRLQALAPARQAKSLPRYPQARVLAADDTAINREVLAEALARFGIRPTLVADGAEALEALQAGSFDLVLMDGSMPVLDGYDATRQQRRRETETGMPRVPIVNFTAHVVGDVATAWKDAGMDGVLYKPFTIDDLAQCLDQWIGGGTVAVADLAPPNGEPATLAEEADVPLLRQSVLDEIASMSGTTGGGFAGRVFSLFRQHAPAALDTIGEAAASGDTAALAAAAHALKSMSGNIGAARVAEEAAALERAARNGTIIAIDPLRDALSRTLSALSDLPGATAEPPAATQRSAQGSA